MNENKKDSTVRICHVFLFAPQFVVPVQFNPKQNSSVQGASTEIGFNKKLQRPDPEECKRTKNKRNKLQNIIRFQM